VPVKTNRDRGRLLAGGRSPRDTYITVYGRIPVLEALNDKKLDVSKVVIADNAHGKTIDEIIENARRRGVAVLRDSAQRVKYLAGNGRQDQGIVADVVARRMQPITEFLSKKAQKDTTLFVLDGITNPNNVGMILRVATAAGIDGIILPRVGSPPVGPLVIKASAGVAFHAPIITCTTAEQAVTELANAGYRIYGLSGSANRSLYHTTMASKMALVLGGETHGISPGVAKKISHNIAIPMTGGVESLNVATAAAVVAFELARRHRD